jgi:SAM-dependent methyltransferase
MQSDKGIPLRVAWNRLSADYQRRHQIPTHSAHYGPWAPLENELRLLGDVRGQRILELGCGGGQCAIAFARQGAQVAGIDLSDAQLAYAQRLADAAQVTVDFVQGTVEDLSVFADGSRDILFSAYAFQYVADMPRCLAECSRVLRAGGRLVFSLDHPFRDCFFDAEEDEMAVFPVRGYFDQTPMHWAWDGAAELAMTSHHHTIATWVEMLAGAGFRLLRLLEPAPPEEMLDEIWPSDDALSALRLIPQTIIFVAEKC